MSKPCKGFACDGNGCDQPQLHRSTTNAAGELRPSQGPKRADPQRVMLEIGFNDNQFLCYCDHSMFSKLRRDLTPAKYGELMGCIEQMLAMFRREL